MGSSLSPALKLLVGVTVVLAAFATGLGAAGADPRWLPRRPGLLARSLLTILVVVPVGAVLFLQAVGAPPIVKAGLTVAMVAIGIGPPAAFSRTKGAATDGDSTISYEVALNVLLMSLAIVYIPAFVAVHGMVFHHGLRLSPAPVASLVLLRALLPLFAGVVVARLAPRLVAPVRRYAGYFVQVILLALVALAVVATRRELVGLGGRAWLMAATLALGAILVGHLLGGPELGTRRVLASFGAMRFPALALLLASIAPHGREFLPVILAYVLSSVVLVAIHGAVTAPRAHHGPAGRAPPTAAPGAGLRGVAGRSGAS
jgi:BASS family bile acid:Na+ symporter